MIKLHTKRDAMLKSVCPRIIKKLDQAIEDSGYCNSLWGGWNEFQVKMRGKHIFLTLIPKHVHTKRWDLTGIPSAHAISTINFREEEPETYLAHWYQKDTYLKEHTHMFEVVSNFQEETTQDKLLPSPIYNIFKGRSKKMRRKEGQENPNNPTRTTRKDRIMHCSKCRQLGHVGASV